MPPIALVKCKNSFSYKSSSSTFIDISLTIITITIAVNWSFQSIQKRVPSQLFQIHSPTTRDVDPNTSLPTVNSRTAIITISEGVGGVEAGG